MGFLSTFSSNYVKKRKALSKYDTLTSRRRVILPRRYPQKSYDCPHLVGKTLFYIELWIEDHDPILQNEPSQNLFVICYVYDGAIRNE